MANPTQTQTQMQMTPEQALQHLDGVSRDFKGTRQDHAVLQTASQQLGQVIAEWRLLKQEQLKKIQEEETRKASEEKMSVVTPIKSEKKSKNQRSLAKSKSDG